MLEQYIEPIANACLLFVPVAMLFTVGYLIVQYRRFGGVALMRSVVVYSFILYSMCAFLLTVLPLPSREKVLEMPLLGFQWIPLKSLGDCLTEAGFTWQPSSWFHLSAWKAFFTSAGLFQILANIVMQIPLGIYLRYYFKRNAWQTLCIGFAVSLFYEMTQLSALYGLYPRPYRYSEIDDLITNTLGAMIGYWLAPLAARLLPSRESLDAISYDKGRRASLTRRFFAAGLDWTLFLLLLTVLIAVIPARYGERFALWAMPVGYIVWVLGYFGVLQWVMGGRTLGKALVRIAIVRENGDPRPSLWALVKRSALLYFLTAPCFALWAMVLTALAVTPLLSQWSMRALVWAAAVIGTGIAITVIALSMRKWKMLPHAALSHTYISADYIRKERAS